jgi:hypothetical protein
MKAVVRMGILILTIVILTMTGLSPSLAGINDGLVAYYPFNGNANDASGNGNHGIVYGATLAPDRFNDPNHAYNFNREDSDYISAPHSSSLNLTDSYSFSVWIYQRSASADGYRIIDKTIAGSCGGWNLDTYDGETGRRIRMDAGCPWVISNTVYSLNQWHHLAVTVNGGNVNFYLDGQPDGSGTVGGTPTNSLDLYIGTSHPVDSYFSFDGLIDDIRIYNRVLTAAEIRELAKSSVASPRISVSPMSVNLGSVKAGSISNPRTVNIKNTGKGTLIINSITISGSNQSEFIESNNCSIVAAKSSCPVTVTFNSTLPFGNKNAVMSISSNDPRKPLVNVKLSGQTNSPKVSVSPKSINFGSVPVGNTSDPKTLTIKNAGISDLTVNAITITGSNDFSWENSCTRIAQGSSCTMGVTLSPTLAGSENALLNIFSNDPTKPTVNVKLSGQAIGGKTGSSIEETYKVITANRWDIVSSTNRGSGYILFTKTDATVSFTGYSTIDSPIAGFTGPVSFIFFKYPVIVGQTWTASGNSNGYILNSVNVVENDAEQISVTAGTFPCAVITESISAPEGYNNGVYVAKRTRYFAPGVGLVKVVDTWKNGDITVGELKAYSIPNALPSDYFPLTLNSWWTFIWK